MKKNFESHILDLTQKFGFQPENWTKLIRLEYKARRLAVAYCNGEIDSDKWDEETLKIEKKVRSLFQTELVGFFINGDPRGFALKIESEKNTLNYSDWGGYGILCPKEG